MFWRRFATTVSLVAILAGCRDGGGSNDTAPPPPTSTTPSTPPSATAAGCSLRERQDWAAAQLKEWYLFPETLPSDTTPTQDTVRAYIDALTATARAQGRDRFFTFLTSIAEENAFFASGSTAGFGFRLSLDSEQRRLFVSEAFERAPALAAGIDRGTEIVAIGTTSSDLRTVDAIIVAEGNGGLTRALGPATAGITRLLRVRDAAGTRDVSVAKAEFELPPVSTRYGARLIDDGGRRVAYVNLRTFISTADPALREAFAQFQAAGVTDFVVDFRYNGGGLVSIANLMGDLLGRNRSASDVFSHTAFRPEKASRNSTRFFSPQPQSVAPMRIAFIGTGGTASASELVINSFVPYLRSAAALIGTNTFGKPVGQIALDRPECDDRLRVVAFASQNAAREGNYFNGLASTVNASCRASDDLSRPLGDPQEASTRQALDFLAGRTCTPISTGGASTQSLGPAPRELLVPAQPTTVQREVPGAF
ncbi:MAG: S41 family peptidase [Pseudomonadota bacterium]|nr:S41 family peptidase [Pseudomonadota bacterium]